MPKELTVTLACLHLGIQPPHHYLRSHLGLQLGSHSMGEGTREADAGEGV